MPMTSLTCSFVYLICLFGIFWWVLELVLGGLVIGVGLEVLYYVTLCHAMYEHMYCTLDGWVGSRREGIILEELGMGMSGPGSW